MDDGYYTRRAAKWAVLLTMHGEQGHLGWFYSHLGGSDISHLKDTYIIMMHIAFKILNLDWCNLPLEKVKN